MKEQGSAQAIADLYFSHVYMLSSRHRQLDNMLTSCKTGHSASLRATLEHLATYQRHTNDMASTRLLHPFLVKIAPAHLSVWAKL